MGKNKGQAPKKPTGPDTKTKQPGDPAKEPEFKTPEEIAAEEQPDKASKLGDDVGALALAAGHAKRAKHKFKEVGLKLWPSTKKQKIIGGIVAGLIIILSVVAVLAIKNWLKDDVASTNPEPKQIVTSNLTGLEVDEKINQRKVIAMMVENSPDARPQASLNEAGVVFEAISEGGITRFCALYLDNMPDYMGPVRSVRPYYVNWLAGFDAAVGHAGGSGEGLAQIARLKVADLDYTKASGYQRVSDRFAPHNLYADLKQLQKAAKQKGFKPSQFEGFKRKPEIKNTGKIKVKNIQFNVSSGLYNATFKYDKKSNSYKRYMAGQPHKDHRSGKPIKPKVVIGLITNYSQSGIYSVYRTSGKGKILVFQDGKVQAGTWKKKSHQKPLQFFDKQGKSIRLNPGMAWITALAGMGEAKYGP
jgi:hypothetical protein